METAKQMVCDGCRKIMPVSDMKYVERRKDSVMALCSSCRGIITKDKKKDIVAPKVQEEPKEVYLCRQCRYKFRYDPKSQGKLRCPYCNSSYDVVKYKLMSADNLLKDDSNFL